MIHLKLLVISLCGWNLLYAAPSADSLKIPGKEHCDCDQYQRRAEKEYDKLVRLQKKAGALNKGKKVSKPVLRKARKLFRDPKRKRKHRASGKTSGTDDCFKW